MKLAAVKLVTVYYEPSEAKKLKVGRLARRDREILFEYDPAFVDLGLQLSPFKLRLQRGVTVCDPNVLSGLPGVFDDSLPDGWGRLLIDRRAAKLGVSAASITPLDRLSLVGSRSMGALTYEPHVELDEPAVVKLSELADDADAVQRNMSVSDLDRLIALGGSPKGARPKALVQIDAKGRIHSGVSAIEPSATAWLVKFPALTDDPKSALLEHAYAQMAAAAGLDTPRTQLLGAAKSKPGYFATERFDRIAGRRVHTHTLGGLQHLPLGPSPIDYLALLGMTRSLTRDEAAVSQMYRLAAFNVLAHNRDDHSRNITFLMNEKGAWRLGPAYDLTFSDGPYGEHAFLVLGEGRSPTLDHLRRLGDEGEVRRAPKILEQVRAVVRSFGDFAAKAGVPDRLTKKIRAKLDEVDAPGPKKRAKR